MLAQALTCLSGGTHQWLGLYCLCDGTHARSHVRQMTTPEEHSPHRRPSDFKRWNVASGHQWASWGKATRQTSEETFVTQEEVMTDAVEQAKVKLGQSGKK